MHQLLWTRSRQDWPEDRVKLQHLDIEIVHFPCIAFRRQSEIIVSKQLELAQTQYPKYSLAFTSPRAIRWLHAHPLGPKTFKQSRKVYVFGKQSEQTLYSLGIPNQRVHAEVAQTFAPQVHLI